MAGNISTDILQRIASKSFSLDTHALKVEANYSITGMSGTEYHFDYIVFSGGEKIAIKISSDVSSINDIMLFNSQCIDSGINKKIMIANRELNENEKRMCQAFGIIIADIKNYENDELYSGRAKFGIPELDAKLAGGLRPGYVYLISGKTGAGKTTLSSMFLSFGAKNNEKGLMVLTDTFPDQFLDNIRTMDIGFGEAYENKMIEIMEISDQIRVMKSEVSSGNTDFRKFITKIITELKRIIITKNIKRVVIDPVTLLLIPDDDYINLFLNSLAMKDVTVIITSGLRTTELSVFGMEEYYVTGIIKLDYVTTGENIDRTLRIVKMRGSIFDSTPSKFKITSAGIIMDGKNSGISSPPPANSGSSDIFKNIGD
ncbi:ATPase domain-containing protein [Acidiplasma sp.]|uniref:RAD55 family ATPase n=2 Tax=Acidiplasma sp. TaxID=1872114 RepID=UPI002584B667|nr:ATPase domain-containing protein [Acidiplasma sp.]